MHVKKKRHESHYTFVLQHHERHKRNSLRPKKFNDNLSKNFQCKQVMLIY